LPGHLVDIERRRRRRWIRRARRPLRRDGLAEDLGEAREASRFGGVPFTRARLLVL
jgi:hypothetical protein